MYYTKLNKQEAVNRLNRLNNLRVLVEGYETGEGYNIWKKVCKALNNTENFTGIIRLTIHEKDFLGYIYSDNEFLSDEDDDVLRFYLKERIDPEFEYLRAKVENKRYMSKIEK